MTGQEKEAAVEWSAVSQTLAFFFFLRLVSLITLPLKF